MRLVRDLAVWGVLSAIFVGGCATPTEVIDPAEGRKMLEQALDVPQDRALIGIYAHKQSGGSEFWNATRKRGFTLSSHGLFAAKVADGFYISHDPSRQKPFFYTVLPGKYTLQASLNQPKSKYGFGNETVTTQQTVEVVVKAGDTRLFKWTQYEKPFLEPIDGADARNDESLLIQKVQVIRLDVKQWANLNARLLTPVESNIPPGNECLPNPLKLRWTNARFEGQVSDCGYVRQGTFTYDDGGRLTARFPHDKRGKVGALVSIDEGPRYRLQPIAHQPLHKAMQAVSLRVDYLKLGAINSGNLVAIDGVRLAHVRPDLPLLIEMLTGDPGSKVTLTFESQALGSKADLVVTRSSPESGSGLSMRPNLALPGIDSQIRYPDGRRYTGPVLFGAAKKEEALPLARPRDSASAKLKALNLHGQLIYADGRGFIGQFDKGLPSGEGYCFKGKRGEACSYWVNPSNNTSHQVYSGEEELEATGYSYRSAEEIRTDFDGLPHSAVIELLRKRWVDALLAEDWTNYLIHMTELQTLGFDTGMESIFYEARALQANGNTELAYDRVQNYINLAGSAGANYAEALDLYTRLEGPARQARQQRLARIAQARKQRRAFCEKLIEQGTLLCGCREFRGQLKGAGARQCKS
ncbi:hypothetical protein [Thiohalophilus sp.]|uniref:hypothetical protein n=1 Tax=Thiohalophilus sp. TaxID=3028392 RepID=UPI002ACE48F1|nr:hypothetical protein [Thiohalophilus sp.]MDZ7802605.1 hypothetical protein [Thiohalophilus sp.]